MKDHTRQWFASRVKEYQEGNHIDLFCDCKRFRGKNANIGIPTSHQPLDCHGDTLKEYIEFLENESKS